MCQREGSVAVFCCAEAVASQKKPKARGMFCDFLEAGEGGGLGRMGKTMFLLRGSWVTEFTVFAPVSSANPHPLGATARPKQQYFRRPCGALHLEPRTPSLLKTSNVFHRTALVRCIDVIIPVYLRRCR